ncbi:MAG: hypothetical protein ACI4S4_05180, partial [Candidatus Ornithospirochaeta sp.]
KYNAEIKKQLEEYRDNRDLSPEARESFEEAIRLFSPTTKEEMKKAGIRAIHARKGDGTKVVIIDGGKGIRVKMTIPSKKTAED